MKNKTKINFLIIAILLFTAGVSAIIILLLPSKGKTVNIQANNKPYEKYSLLKNRTVEIKSESGYNILKIEDGYAFIEKSDCKNQVCVHHKKINKNGENIVCLPHGVVITIEDDENE